MFTRGSRSSRCFPHVTDSVFPYSALPVHDPISPPGSLCSFFVVSDAFSDVAPVVARPAFERVAKLLAQCS